MNDEEVNIKFSKDEAIILFEFLSRFSNKEKLDIEHQAEERVLWDLTCSLENGLAEPFLKDYAKFLQEARERLKDIVD